jgi:hypothetical protein
MKVGFLPIDVKGSGQHNAKVRFSPLMLKGQYRFQTYCAHLKKKTGPKLKNG